MSEEQKRVPINRRGVRLVLANGRELIFPDGAGWQVSQHGAMAVTEYNGRYDQNGVPLSDVVCLFNVGEYKAVGWMNCEQIKGFGRKLKSADDPVDIGTADKTS